jgi:hypothetical protein
LKHDLIAQPADFKGYPQPPGEVSQSDEEADDLDQTEEEAKDIDQNP